MISFDEASRRILDAVVLLEEEIIPVEDSLDRVVYDVIFAHANVPAWNNSAMDGFAVNSSDTLAASTDSPVRLEIVDEYRAGPVHRPSGKNTQGASIRIMTGAVIPDGMDAVIPVENVIEEDTYLRVEHPVVSHENIRFAGEDIKAGSIVLNKGMKVKPSSIGLLASLNQVLVRVYRLPSVAVITTGDEIVEIGTPANYGQIYNSNAHTLMASLCRLKCKVAYLGIVKDDIATMTDIFRTALMHDVVITTGGISKGKYDFVPEVLSSMGIDIHIRGVSIKPGKPFMWGTKDRVHFFGLPGNPVSTLVTFEELVRPALLKMSGANWLQRPVVKARLTEKVEKKAGRTEFIRGIYSISHEGFFVSTTGPQGSGILRSMNEANCVIVLSEEDGTMHPGTQVDIQLIHHEECC